MDFSEDNCIDNGSQSTQAIWNLDSIGEDLHGYLSQFLDASTLLLFPLTCRAIYMSIGFKSFTLETAVEASAVDDNLTLLLYFLRDNTSRRSRDFYRTHIFYPMTANNSWKVFAWYMRKKYKIPHQVMSKENGKTISIEMLDELHRVVDTLYDDDLLAEVIRHDREDVFALHYLGKISISQNQVKTMMVQDSFKCFSSWIETIRKEHYYEIKLAAVCFAGNRIVNHLLFCISKQRSGGLRSEVVTRLVSNPNYNSVKFMTYFPLTDPLTDEQITLAIKCKTAKHLMELTKDTTFIEGHFRAAIARKNAEVINYIASKFEDKADIQEMLFTTPFCKIKLNISLVAEKLVHLKCLEKFIIRERNYDLFKRLAEETHLTGMTFDDVIRYSYDRRLAEIYLDYQVIPIAKQVGYYTKIGEEFVKLLESKGFTVSRSIDNKRKRDATKDQRQTKKQKK